MGRVAKDHANASGILPAKGNESLGVEYIFFMGSKQTKSLLSVSPLPYFIFENEMGGLT